MLSLETDPVDLEEPLSPPPPSEEPSIGDGITSCIESILAQALAQNTQPSQPQQIAPEIQESPTGDYRKYCEAVKIAPYDKLEGDIEIATGTIATMNEAELITDGREAGIILLHAIQAAKEKIKINLYAWHGDSSGLKFADAIKKASPQNGKSAPKVEVIIDLLGSLMVGSIQGFQDPKVLASIGKQLLWRKKPQNIKEGMNLVRGKVLMENGTSVLSVWKIMNIMADPDGLNSFTQEEEEILEKLTREILNEEMLKQLNPAVKMLLDAGINLKVTPNSLAGMDHTKVFVVDHRAMVTGTNIADYYSGTYDQTAGWNAPGKELWHDYAVLLKGPAVQVLEALFFDQKIFAIPPRISAPESASESAQELSRIRVLENKPGRYTGEPTDPKFAKEKQITFTVLQLIQNAEGVIILDQAYMMDEAVTVALMAAARRGVKVKILKGKPEAVNLEYSIGKYLRRLNAVEGVEISQSDDVSHAKCISVDGKYSLTGSVNMSSGSLTFNREVAVMTCGDSPLQKATDTALGDRLKKVHRINFSAAERVKGIVRAML